MIPRICYVTDGQRGTGGRSLGWVLKRVVAAGVGLVILREPTLAAAELEELLEALGPRRSARLLISRRADLARAYGLDGVHLAADAVPIRLARRWLGSQALIGYSAHSGAEARRAASEGASYVTLSPIYPTGSKPGLEGRGPEWLAAATKNLPIPALALGGLTPARVSEVVDAGAWGIAAVEAIGAQSNIERAVQDFRAAFSREET